MAAPLHRDETYVLADLADRTDRADLNSIDPFKSGPSRDFVMYLALIN